MSQQGARTAFAAAGDVAAGEGRGTDFGRVSEVLEGFQNIFLKGGINERKLVNLGVNAPDFYRQLASQLRLGSADEAKKRAEAGKIDPQTLLNAIYHGIEQKQGGKLGTGTIATSQSYQARLERLQNLPNEYLKNLVESPAFNKASDMLAGLLEKLDPEGPAGTRIMAAIESMFDKIGDLIGDPETAAERFASGVESAVHLVKELIDTAGQLADAFAPSLDTIQDMVIGLREFVAISSHDTEGTRAAVAEEAHVRAERMARLNNTAERFANQNRTQAAGEAASNVVAGNFGIYAPTPNAGAIAAAAKSGGAKVIQLNVHPGAVVVHAKDDSDGAHKEAAQKLVKEIHREVERAAQEGGG
jgi:hypothetical protein